MKNIIFMVTALLIICSCNGTKSSKSDNSIDQLCDIKPADWNCKKIENKTDSVSMPDGLSTADLVFEYTAKDNSLVYLYCYNISKKSEIESIIQESMKKATCVPVFFAENADYFVVTSSCYVNSSFFTSNTNLKPNIEKQFTKFSESIVK